MFSRLTRETFLIWTSRSSYQKNGSWQVRVLDRVWTHRTRVFDSIHANRYPQFALIGSKFVHRSFETNGIEFELLLSPKHRKNLSALAPAVPALQEWVARQIDSLERAGLRYPLGTLSFVEVPTHLRVYGGGWNMGSAYSPPGIHMIRESGFPLAQFQTVKTDAEKEFGDDIESVGKLPIRTPQALLSI